MDIAKTGKLCASKKKKKWSAKCLYCGSLQSKNKELHFFKFPRSPFKCKQWVLACNLKSYLDVDSMKMISRRLCSKHFADDDYFITHSGRCKLKPEAVPFMLDTGKQMDQVKISVTSLKQKLQCKLNGDFNIDEEDPDDPKCFTSVSEPMSTRKNNQDLHASDADSYDNTYNDDVDSINQDTCDNILSSTGTDVEQSEAVVDATTWFTVHEVFRTFTIRHKVNKISALLQSKTMSPEKEILLHEQLDRVIDILQEDEHHPNKLNEVMQSNKTNGQLNGFGSLKKIRIPTPIVTGPLSFELRY